MGDRLHEELRQALDSIQALRDGPANWMPLGLPRIDDRIGWRVPPGSVTVLVSPERQALSMAAAALWNLAVQRSPAASCGVLLAGVPRSEIAHHMLATPTGLDARALRRVRLDDDQTGRVMQAAAKLWDAPVTFGATWRSIALAPPRGIVVVALLECLGRNALDRLERLSRRVGAPVLAISQRSRRWVLRNVGEPFEVIEVAGLYGGTERQGESGCSW